MALLPSTLPLLVVMKALLSANPDSVEMKTFRGETVFHLSVSNNQLGAFELLMEHVKKFKKEQILNEKDEKGSTILRYAVSRKQYQVGVISCCVCYFLFLMVCQLFCYDINSGFNAR